MNHSSKNPDRLKKILAWAGIILLAGIYLTTFILGFFGSPATADLLKASIVCTVVVPVLMYAMLLLARVLKDKDHSSAASEETKK